MENLLFSLNATIPVFLLMVVGYFLNKMNILDDTLALKLNSFVFKVSLPLLLFVDVSKSNFKDLWDTKFVVFCVVSTLISILLSILFSLRLKDKAIQGEFIQACYRSSAALLGLALTALGMRATVDSRNEKLGYRVREAQLQKVTYQIVVGDGEQENNTVTIRQSGKKDSVTLSLDEALAKFKAEVDNKTLFGK